MFVARIYKGYKIKTEAAIYEVLDSCSIRGKYKYVVRDTRTEKVFSLCREDVMQAQKDGDCTVYL